jgi:hypothetical protein
MKKPSEQELDAACELLTILATRHGLRHLRHGRDAGEVVADVDDDRTYFDVVAFEDDVEGRLGWRPDVTDAAAPGARSRRPVGTGDTDAA